MFWYEDVMTDKKQTDIVIDYFISCGLDMQSQTRWAGLFRL